MQPVSESPRLLAVFKAVCTLILQLTWRVSERRTDDSTHSISLLKGRGMWLQACTHFPTPGETGHYLHCHSEATKMTHTRTSQPHWNTVPLCRETNVSSPKVTKMQLSSVLGPQPECFVFFEKTRYFPSKLSEFSQAGSVLTWPKSSKKLKNIQLVCYSL